MADMNDNVPSFSIESTMDMGMGDQSLINSLLEPETASSKPEDIKPLEDPKEPEKPKDVKPAKPEEKTPDKPSEEKSNPLHEFFESDDDDEESNEDGKEKVDHNLESKTEDNNDDNVEVSQFEALAKDLFKLGVFTEDEDEEEGNVEIKTAEDFLEKFNAEKKKGASEYLDNFLSQFGEDYKNAFEAIYVKGVNPKEYFNTYNTIVNFAELDLEQESNQITVMKQALHDQGFDAEDIETEIERLKNYGDLEVVSKRHHKVLVRKEAQKLNELQEKSENELRQKEAYKKQYAKNVSDILQEKLKVKEFDGIPLNPKLATELQDFLLIDKWKTPSGETLTDFDKSILELKKPENHAMKVKVALLLKVLEKDPTLSTIQKAGVTKKTDSLFNEVVRVSEKTKISKASGNSNKNSSFSYL